MMKNNIENSFRESLENMEFPYNPDAWKSMNAKLDAKMPVRSFKTKWFIASGILVVAALTSSILFFTKDDTQKKSVISERTEIKETDKTQNENEVKTTTSSIHSEVNESSVNQESTKDVVDVKSDKIQKIDSDIRSYSSNEDVAEHKTENKENLEISSKSETTNTTSNKKSDNIISHENIIIPTIPSVCVGEEVSIENVNDIEIIIGGPWYSHAIKPHSTAKLTFKNEGTYIISEKTEGSENIKTFTVKELPNADFRIENDIKYKDGLPTIQLTSHTEGEITWEYENTIAKGYKINPHFFEKGNHPVKITIVGENGCANSLEKDIYIEETYNLMAVNSFIPDDNDIRRNKFMPYALTQRKDVQFTLIILDPTDGHIVYQTNDVTAGWTGIDQQSGQQVKYEKAYIWKVIISNPVKGEKGEYAGTITPLTK